MKYKKENNMKIDELYTIYTPGGYTPPDDYEGGFCKVCDEPSFGNDICSNECHEAFMM
jgi:hypothetical protein